MAQIDPNIILSAVQAQRSGSTPFTKLQDIMQFQNLIAEQEKRQAQQQKQQTISDLIRSNVSKTDAGIQLNQPQFIQQLSQIDPQMALQEQERINLQQAKVAQQQAQEKKMIAEADTKSLERARERGEMISSAAGAVLSAPPEQQQSILDSQLDLLIDNGVLTTEMLQGGNIPLVINPQNLQVLEGIRNSSLSAKEQVDIELENRKLTRTQKDDTDKKLKELKKQNFSQSSDLRKEYSKLSGDFVKQRDAFDRVQASAEDPSPAGDLALIFNYMKVLDPGSTVREGEFANAERSGSVPEKVWGKYNKVLKGERLAPTVRNDFVNRSQKLFAKAVKNNDRLKSQFTEIAKKNELDPTQVILDFRTATNVEFDTVEQAEAAKLPSGTEITIQGRRAVVE